MPLSPLTPNNFPAFERRLKRKPELKKKLSEDLEMGLKSAGFFIPEDFKEEIEILLRRTLLDLAPLTSETISLIEEKMQSEPAFAELLSEDPQQAFETIGYYMPKELWSDFEKKFASQIGKYSRLMKEEVQTSFMNEKNMKRRRLSITVSREE